MFRLNLTVCIKEKEDQNKIILKNQKISTKLRQEDNSLLRVVILSFHHGLKMAPEPGICIPYFVSGEDFQTFP